MEIISLRLTIFISTAVCLGVLERFYSYRTRSVLRFQRWPSNLTIGLIDIVTIRIIFPLGLVGVAGWGKVNHVGLFNYFNFNDIFSSILGFLILDLAIYFQHVYSHKWKFLWRFHRVHHTDLDLDLTTAIRFHPIEILFSAMFKILLVFLFGISPEVILFFEIVLSSMAMFNHSNLFIPHKLEKKLRLFFVTPQMHIVHHSVERFESDTNFGFNFSCWDFIFRTYRDVFSSSGRIGQKGYEDIDSQGVAQLLIQPIQK